jgi:nucleotide-binding universal stress UspA family protein
MKDILVHLDGGPEDDVRLSYAESLASTCDAYLTGVFTHPIPDFTTLIGMEDAGVAASMIPELEKRAREDGDPAHARLKNRFATLRVPGEIKRFDAPLDILANRVAALARRADLLVARRPYDDDGNAHWDGLVEAVLFGSGRGLLLVPPGRGSKEPIRHVLVAWRDSREAARALGEALPIIERSTATTVLAVNPDRAVLTNTRDEEELATHLERHGATVDVRVVTSNGVRVSEVLRNEGRRLSADLVVMGSYGHSRVREWVLGGTTLEMMTSSELPILVAH